MLSHTNRIAPPLIVLLFLAACSSINTSETIHQVNELHTSIPNGVGLFFSRGYRGLEQGHHHQEISVWTNKEGSKELLVDYIYLLNNYVFVHCCPVKE